MEQWNEPNLAEFEQGLNNAKAIDNYGFNAVAIQHVIKNFSH